MRRITISQRYPSGWPRPQLPSGALGTRQFRKRHCGTLKHFVLPSARRAIATCWRICRHCDLGSEAKILQSYSDGRILVRPQRPQEAEWVSLDHFDHDSSRHIVDVFGQDRHARPRTLREWCPLKTDPASFEKLDGPSFKDKQQAYYIDSTARLPELLSSMSTWRVSRFGRLLCS